MSTTATTDLQKITTGKCRLSYVFLTKPRKDPKKPEDPGKYMIDLIIPKTATETLKRIDTAIKAAIEAGKTDPKTAFTDKTVKGEKFWNPLRDGDVREDGDPAYENAFYLCAKASADKKPKVVDASGNEILDADEIYSGMYGRVSLRFYPYKNEGVGIGVALYNVQKLADGVRLGGGHSDPEKDFAEDVVDDDDL